MKSNMFSEEQGDTMDRTAEYIELERKIHPWASDDILERIVADELKRDPKYYDKEEEAMEPEEDEEDGGLTIILGKKKSKGPTKDPFAEDEAEEEQE